MKKRLHTILVNVFLTVLLTFPLLPWLSLSKGAIVEKKEQSTEVAKAASAEATTAKGATIEEKIHEELAEKEKGFELKPSPVEEKADVTGPDVGSYVLLDADSGEVLAEKASDQRTPIASLTKIMTAVVALDLAEPGEVFTVTPDAASQIPTKIGVNPGEKLTLNELLNAALLHSGNDAAQVIKDGIDERYGPGKFIEAMNSKARVLGLVNTSFANPQGFDDPNNFSSASDLATLSKYALENYPLITEIVRKEETSLPANPTHKNYNLRNFNGLVGVYPGAFGFKVGYTGKAGYTTVVAAERGGKKILAVVLNTADMYERDLKASQLLDLGFQKTIGTADGSVSPEQIHSKYRHVFRKGYNTPGS